MKILKYKEFSTTQGLCDWVNNKGELDRVVNIVCTPDGTLILFHWMYGD